MESEAARRDGVELGAWRVEGKLYYWHSCVADATVANSLDKKNRVSEAAGRGGVFNTRNVKVYPLVTYCHLKQSKIPFSFCNI